MISFLHLNLSFDFYKQWLEDHLFKIEQKIQYAYWQGFVHVETAGFMWLVSFHTLFFYKHIFYNNIEADICEILRIF